MSATEKDQYLKCLSTERVLPRFWAIIPKLFKTGIKIAGIWKERFLLVETFITVMTRTLK